MPQPKVRIFSSPSCPYCFTLKKFLEEKSIKFEEIDVSKNKTAREEITEKTGRMEVPVIEIDGKVVTGFDKKEIIKLLNIKE